MSELIAGGLMLFVGWTLWRSSRRRPVRHDIRDDDPDLSDDYRERYRRERE